MKRTKRLRHVTLRWEKPYVSPGNAQWTFTSVDETVNRLWAQRLAKLYLRLGD